MGRTYVVTVGNVEYKDTKDGSKKYMVATLIGKAGKQHTVSVFDTEVKESINEASDNNKALSITMDKNDRGYWDITSAQVTKQAVESSESVNKSEPQKSEMTKEDWDEKDRIKKTSIERQSALQIAGANWKPGEPTDPVITAAIRFAEYLTDGK